MKALVKKIRRQARPRDDTPPGPDDTFVGNREMKAAIERAEAAMAERDWSRATALWREVLAQFGDRAPRSAHLRLSQALRRDGNVDAAQAVLLERLQGDPEAHRLRRDLTELATNQADWERVARLWEDVLGSASTPTTEIANGLAGALCQLGRFREADGVLQRGLAAGIDRRDVQSVFDSAVLRTQFLGRFDLTASGFAHTANESWAERGVEWYRVAVGARRLRDASGLNAAVTAPSAICVDGPRGGWGNGVWQLVHALEVAERLGVPRVYIGPSWYVEGDDPFHCRDHEVIQSGSPRPEERLVLRGSFLVLQLWSGQGDERLSPYRRLAALRPFTRFRHREPLGENDLVIHIRAGDVFRKEAVNPGYGQPPLAYYLTVLHQRQWRSIHLVFENDHNPVIKPLLNHLRAKGIEPRTVVTDLTSTIEFLLTAKTIVAGPGTFIPTIVGLSSNLRRLYTFEGLPRWLVGSWEPPGIAHIEVIDHPGDYRRAVMSYNWKNSPAQVQLMLHYPESALRLVPRPTPR